MMTAPTERPDQGDVAQLERATSRIRLLTITVVLLAVALIGLGVFVIYDQTAAEEYEEAGATIGEMVMEAWASGDQADIEAVYDSDVIMVLDGETLAEDRGGITSVITGAISVGNAYEQVGPVAVYEASDGDLYVATLVEVTGAAHPEGVPVAGFYRVRDGKVIRHVFMDAEHY